ncbi:MAG: hypothetical protein R2791_06820 [Saprospiraceae bacterium]
MQTKHIFPDFVSRFPPVGMPVTLGEDTHHIFSTENKPLSESLISQFIQPTEETVTDEEFTEYIPCFAIDDTEHFIALVWWKAELMNYEYVLATFTLKGELIDRQVIAFTRVEDGKVHRAVVTINEEYELIVVEGTSTGEDDFYDPSSARTRHLEIMATGEIV